MLIALGLLVIVLASWAMTGWLRRYALTRDVLDIPNARSSHRLPTPRGGGVAIVISSALAFAVLGALGGLSREVCWALLGSGLLVAAVGFADDHRPLAARWRLLVHFLAAAWGLLCMGGMPSLSLFGGEVLPAWLLCGLGLVYLVWLLNLYNFMDGIDGIAAVEAITVCSGGALLYVLLGHAGLAQVPMILALACAGFLFWNFPAARIFMGDAGSGYLGIMLGLFSLQAGWVEPQLFWAWLILLGVFMVDASVTLLHRLMRGERVYLAHRSHAYQYASRRYGQHWPVTLAVAVINLIWLLPLAIWVAYGANGPLVTLLAYAPLIMLALWFKAGQAEPALQQE